MQNYRNLNFFNKKSPLSASPFYCRFWFFNSIRWCWDCSLWRRKWFCCNFKIHALALWVKRKTFTNRCVSFFVPFRFLSFEEKISDVVAQDLASLDFLNIDKHVLVQELRSLIAKFNLRVSKPTPMTTIEIVVHRDENHVFGSKSTYCVTRLIPKGLPQRCLFRTIIAGSVDALFPPDLPLLI